MGLFNGKKKRVFVSGMVIILAVSGAIMAMAVIPAGFFPGDPGSQLRFTPLGFARLAHGRGLVTSDAGTDILQWRWCPAQGLNVLCFRATGVSGFFRGEIAILPGQGTIRQLSFSGVRPGDLGLAGLPSGARLRGELENLVFRWSEACPHRALVSSRGRLQLAGLDGGDHRIELEGDHKDGVSLEGRLVSGQLKLTTSRLSGRLQVALPGAENRGRQRAEINVSRAMDCL